MKHIRQIILVILCMTLLFGMTVTVFAEDTQPVSTDSLSGEGITDHLETAEQINRYSFTLPEDGGAMLFVQSHQENWNGYTYSWHATIYDTDGTTVLDQVQIRGATHLTTRTLNDLKAGTYYVDISTAADTSNPLMSGFAKDPYEISFVALVPSAVPQYEKDTVGTVSKGKEIICVRDGVYFIKMFDGPARVALQKNRNSEYLPVLVGETQESVAYIISTTGSIVEASNWQAVKYDGKEYYYSFNSDIQNFSDPESSLVDSPLYVTESAEHIVKNILEHEKAVAAGGEFSYFMQNNWKTVLIVGAIALVIVVWIVVAYIRDKHTPSRSHSRYSSSGSGYGSSSYGSNDDDEQRWRDLDDMRIIRDISDRINTPGYDPEGPPADVESFPDSSSIW